MIVHTLGQAVQKLFHRKIECVKMPVESVLTTDLFEKIKSYYNKREAYRLSVQKNTGGFLIIFAELADSNAESD